MELSHESDGALDMDLGDSDADSDLCWALLGHESLIYENQTERGRLRGSMRQIDLPSICN